MMKVQKPMLRVHSLRTTVTVPDRGTLLLGGWVDSVTSATTRQTSRTYLLLKPTVNRPKLSEGDHVFPRQP